MKIVAFCEAPADFRIASDLADRVLRDAGPSWVGDVLDAAADGVRVYQGDGRGREFFDIHQLDKYVEQFSVRVPHGHFDGRPGAAGALMARTVFAIARKLQQIASVDAVVLVWDMDVDPDGRQAGLTQARNETRQWATFRIVLGCPNRMREAWVLVGFDPDGAEEEGRVAALRGELGFSPIMDAHLLTSNDPAAKRSPKRVLRALTLDDNEREERCWTQTPLAALRARGEPTGLRAYLLEIEQHLLPLLHAPLE